jgi:hypothetical protein
MTPEWFDSLLDTMASSTAPMVEPHPPPGASDELIVAAEARLRVRFSVSYRRFLSRMGQVDFGATVLRGLYDPDFDHTDHTCVVHETLWLRDSAGMNPAFVAVYGVGEGTEYVLDTSQMISDECPVLAWRHGLDAVEEVFRTYADFLSDQVSHEIHRARHGAARRPNRLARARVVSAEEVVRAMRRYFRGVTGMRLFEKHGHDARDALAAVCAEGEVPVIASWLDASRWALLTNDRLLWRGGAAQHFVPIREIARADLQPDDVLTVVKLDGQRYQIEGDRLLAPLWGIGAAIDRAIEVLDGEDENDDDVEDDVEEDDDNDHEEVSDTGEDEH